jgi:hypothetical protein
MNSNKDKKLKVNVSLDPEIYEKVEEAAKRWGRTTAGEVAHVIGILYEKNPDAFSFLTALAAKRKISASDLLMEMIAEWEAREKR